MEGQKKNTNTTFKNGKLFCLNCGHKMRLPDSMTPAMFRLIVNQYNAEHANCVNWKHAEVDLKRPIMERAKWWIDNGDKSPSSKAIFEMMCPEFGAGFKSEAHPEDPNDFRRCYILLQNIPEWRDHLWSMRQLSPAWMYIVDNWDRLCWLLEEQLSGKENDLWPILKKLNVKENNKGGLTHDRRNN